MNVKKHNFYRKNLLAVHRTRNFAMSVNVQISEGGKIIFQENSLSSKSLVEKLREIQRKTNDALTLLVEATKRDDPNFNGNCRAQLATFRIWRVLFLVAERQDESDISDSDSDECNEPIARDEVRAKKCRLWWYVCCGKYVRTINKEFSILHFRFVAFCVIFKDVAPSVCTGNCSIPFQLRKLNVAVQRNVENSFVIDFRLWGWTIGLFFDCWNLKVFVVLKILEHFLFVKEQRDDAV